MLAFSIASGWNYAISDSLEIGKFFIMKETIFCLDQYFRLIDFGILVGKISNKRESDLLEPSLEFLRIIRFRLVVCSLTVSCIWVVM